MTTCPSEVTLRLIGTEAVGEAIFGGLEEHVEQCPDCQKVLEAATNAAPQAAHPAPARNATPNSPASSSSASWAGEDRAWFTSPANPR